MAKTGGNEGGINGEAGVGEAGDDESDDDDDDDEPDPCVLPTSIFCHFFNLLLNDAGLFGSLQYGKNPNFCAYTSCGKSKLKGLRPMKKYPQPYTGNLVLLDYFHSPDSVSNTSGGNDEGLFLFWNFWCVFKYANRIQSNNIHITFSSKNSKMSISKDIEESSTSRKDLLVLTREMPSNLSSFRVKQVYLELNTDVSIMERQHEGVLFSYTAGHHVCSFMP